MHKNKIYDKDTLYEKFNPKILKIYQNKILNEIDNNLYKFTELNYDSITLYYNKYQIKRDKNIILKLIKIYEFINNL